MVSIFIRETVSHFFTQNSPSYNTYKFTQQMLIKMQLASWCHFKFDIFNEFAKKFRIADTVKCATLINLETHIKRREKKKRSRMEDSVQYFVQFNGSWVKKRKEKTNRANSIPVKLQRRLNYLVWPFPIRLIFVCISLSAKFTQFSIIGKFPTAMPGVFWTV